MKRQPKPYQLKPVRLGTVQIQYNHGKDYRYPYNDRITYLEISTNIDSKTLQGDGYHYRLQSAEHDPLANWQSREHAIYYVGDDAITEAENAITKQIKHIPAILRKGKAHPVYTIMAGIVAQVVKHYKQDFTYYDTLILADLDPGTQFFWIVRDSGTQLIIISQNNKFGEDELKYYQKDQTAEYYRYDGTNLLGIDKQQALKIYDYWKGKLINAQP